MPPDADELLTRHRKQRRQLLVQNMKSPMSLRIPLPDRPGQLARVSELLAGVGANVIEVLHTRHGQGLQISEVILQLSVETRGADGVGWARADGTSTPRQHPIAVDPLDVDDTTGAGDTFVGTLTALLASSAPVASLEDTTIDELVTRASRAATALLRERTTSSATTADAPQKENH